MKYQILVIMLLLQTADTHSMGFLSNYFWPQEVIQEVKEEAPIEVIPVPKKAKVGIFYLANGFDFQQVLKTLTLAAKNNELFGLILLIDNNGGDAGQFSTLHDLIKKITTIKPVVGVVCGSALSGGYMVASATDYLLCSEASNVGSIGAISEIQKLKEQHLVANPNNNLDAKLDVEIFSAGTYKAMYNSYSPLTPEQRRYLQEGAEKGYRYFINLIARNRSLAPENYLEWADAKIFLGYEAKELGLVDKVGTILDAEEKILELIKLKSPDTNLDSTIEVVELS